MTEKHPTLFVIDGTIKCYDDGSMLELHGQITDDEWRLIVEETIRYKVFIECLRDVACPMLQESWSEEDKWFCKELDVAVSRMRNIDPFLVSTHDQKKLIEAFASKMKMNAAAVQEMIEDIRLKKKELIRKRYEDGESTVVSDL